MPEVPDVPPDDESGGIYEGGMSELPVPELWLLLPLVPLVPPDSDGMPPDELPVLLVPPLELPPELVPELLPLPEPEPPPVMPAHAPSSRAQARGNIHFVIKHSR